MEVTPNRININYLFKNLKDYDYQNVETLPTFFFCIYTKNISLIFGSTLKYIIFQTA